MYRDFDDWEFEPRNQARDREITLGPMLLTGLGLILCAACAGFFVLGYAVGHRRAAVAEAPMSMAGESGPTVAGEQRKPAATLAVAPAESAAEAVADGAGTAKTAPTGGAVVQAALGQGTPWMVQIAAVSHQEDADVLVGALQKRGYVVSARRDPADDLVKVQVGPFPTHADAAAMRQRLLNDGYNAIIEP